MSRQALIKRAKARKELAIRRARSDPNAFIEYVGAAPDGTRLRQSQFHRELQEQFGRSRSVTHASVYTGKTLNLMHRLVWEVGRDPNITINYISATKEHPVDVHLAWQTEITENPRVREVFPHLRRGRVWSTTKSVVDRSSREPSPTFRVFGAFTKSLLGKRAAITAFDDLCGFANTLTEHSREQMSKWIGEALSRGTRDNRVMYIGHIWKEDDQLCREARKEGVSYRRYEATEPDRHDNTVAWQTSMPAEPHEDRLVERLDEDGDPIPIAPDSLDLPTLRQREVDLGAVMSMMMLRNRVPSLAMGRFTEAMFAKCLRRGRGLGFLTETRWTGALTFTGVDLGHKKGPGKDWTVLFTAMALPGGDRHVIDIRSGRWKAGEIRDQIRKVQAAFMSTVFVEDNGGQNLFIDLVNEFALECVRPHHTGINKHDLVNGVQGLAEELDQSQWILPCSENDVPGEEMAKAIKGCMSYDPTKPKDHTSDWLMAWWICREGMRTSIAANMGGGIALPGRAEMHGLMDR